MGRNKPLILFILVVFVAAMTYWFFAAPDYDRVLEYVNANRDVIATHDIHNQMRIDRGHLSGGYNTTWQMGDLVIVSKPGSGIPDPAEHWIIIDTANFGPPLKRLYDLKPNIVIYDFRYLGKNIYEATVRY